MSFVWLIAGKLSEIAAKGLIRHETRRLFSDTPSWLRVAASWTSPGFPAFSEQGTGTLSATHSCPKVRVH